MLDFGLKPFDYIARADFFLGSVASAQLGDNECLYERVSVIEQFIYPELCTLDLASGHFPVHAEIIAPGGLPIAALARF